MLVIDNLPEGSFTLEIRNTCAPEKNTELSGLYTSGGGFFTQCEAEGFRRITYFLDRPDVMAGLHGDAARRQGGATRCCCPTATWSSRASSTTAATSPAGTTRSRSRATCSRWWPPTWSRASSTSARAPARTTCCRSMSRRGDLDKTEHAMDSLMRVDASGTRRASACALDLERFMIVAVDDFNMGAMENKGLNIFNTKYVLASPATATDDDFAASRRVVGHEYFHNWTGNRITCRDWFQLSLKEGLTVFRDQEFSMDMVGSASARAVKRIAGRARACAQCSSPRTPGPMAHPVRPDSYVEINNFYTATVYEKGAEVVRMMQTLVGREGFRARHGRCTSSATTARP